MSPQPPEIVLARGAENQARVDKAEAELAAQEQPLDGQPLPPEGQAIPAEGIACVILFVDAPDRNIQMVWVGQLPQLQHIIELKGRTGTWRVVEVRWLLNVQRTERILERGVRITLKQDE